MLADDLIADRRLASILGPGRDRFVADLRRAHRFDLDRNFTVAADELGTSRPSSFSSAISTCRPPYDPTWIETSQSYRSRFTAAPLRPEEMPIKRIGFLFQAIEGSSDHGRWAATMAWSFANGETAMSSLVWLYDAAGKGLIFPELGRAPDLDETMDMIRRENGLGGRWQNADREIRASAQLTVRGRSMRSPYHTERLTRVKAQGGDSVARQLDEDAVRDWAAEMVFVLGTLALLNSRNAVDIDDAPDMTRLNRSRRRGGKAELLSFRTCRISRRLTARIAAQHGQAEEAGIRAHFVRGHFKARKSGVFWWSPFLRGDARHGLVMKDYRVEGDLAHPPAPARGSV